MHKIDLDVVVAESLGELDGLFNRARRLGVKLKLRTSLNREADSLVMIGSPESLLELGQMIGYSEDDLNGWIELIGDE